LSKQPNNRDEVMKHEVLKILSLSPPIFWKETYYLGTMLNPALEEWNNKIFFTWRNGMYDSPINYAWFDMKNLGKHFELKNRKKLPNFDEILSISIADRAFNHLQEDPRLIHRKDNRMMILYTSKESLFTSPKQCYCHISFQKSINNQTTYEREYVVSDSILLDGHTLDRHQKNWIPIIDSITDDLYFIQSVNPLHILKHHQTDTNQVGIMESVYSTNSTLTLPWRSEYGHMIRGGTPTKFIHGHYLAFFHSVSQLQKKNPMRTYFMGAIRFCPIFPYHIHSISTHPILQEQYYDGYWVEPRRTDYVMFAIGIVYLEEKDPLHVFVSYGHQDRDGYLAKFHLQELYDSMEIVNNCSKEIA
jgi:hypothetical protein